MNMKTAKGYERFGLRVTAYSEMGELSIIAQLNENRLIYILFGASISIFVRQTRQSKIYGGCVFSGLSEE